MDRTFDRKVSFDERSRQFPIRTLVPQKPVTRTWNCKTYLDQGQEGACVGFGWSHELAATPKVIHVTNKSAHDLYKQAQTLDEFPGENYDGTSVIAGAKAVLADGFMKEYRWAFGLDDMILALSHAGPVVLGLNWYRGMMDPDKNGFLVPDNNLAGGHCILANGVNVEQKFITVHNSWGKSWGKNGEAKISFADMTRLLAEQGEVCVPVGRLTGVKK
jgi:hypothetical protein